MIEKGSIKQFLAYNAQNLALPDLSEKELGVEGIEQIILSYNLYYMKNFDLVITKFSIDDEYICERYTFEFTSEDNHYAVRITRLLYWMLYMKFTDIGLDFRCLKRRYDRVRIYT